MRNKPLIFWPSILVYRIVHAIFSGIFYILFAFINLFLFISLIWWKIVKIPFLPFILISKNINSESRLKSRNEKDKKRYEKEIEILNKKEKIKLEKDKQKFEKLENKRKAEEAKKQKIEAEQQLKEQQKLLHETKKEEKKILTDKVSEKLVEKPKTAKELKIEEKKKRAEEKKLKIEEKRKRKNELAEEKRKRKQEIKAKKKKLKDNSVYVNENVTIEKSTIGDKINNSLEKIISVPQKIVKGAKDKLKNNALIKNKKNEDMMKREALLINFDGKDAEKSDKKVVFEYVGKTAEGKLVKDYFDAYSKVEVHSFLLSEGFEVYSIKTNAFIRAFHTTNNGKSVKIKNKDLIFFLAQLSTYIKAGIPLVESLRILSRQFKNKNYEKIFRSLIYDLTMGNNFSDAMAKREGAFPRILINMVKASEMTGDLPETLDDMGLYFEEMEKTRKQMITALTYPSIILIFALVAISFIMIYIVPKFINIYEEMDNAELPWITVATLTISDFLKSNLVQLLIGISIFIIVIVWMYKNVKIFRTLCQWFAMKLPIMGNVIIFNEVTMFTKTFSSLLKHNVFITDSMDILNKITSNEIWKMIILDTITNLAKGDKISMAFQDHWAVPIPAYEMIVTGERTGQLPEMMEKVSNYYQELHKNQVGRIKAFIEPILILFLTGAVGLIVMSIIIPMFGMYTNLS